MFNKKPIPSQTTHVGTCQCCRPTCEKISHGRSCQPTIPTEWPALQTCFWQCPDCPRQKSTAVFPPCLPAKPCFAFSFAHFRHVCARFSFRIALKFQGFAGFVHSVHAPVCFLFFTSKQKCENSFAGLAGADNSRQKLPDGSATFCFSAGSDQGFSAFSLPKASPINIQQTCGACKQFFKEI